MEQKIIELVNLGKTTPEIAKELNTKYSTIRYYVQKLNLPVKQGKLKITDEIIQMMINLNKEGLTNKQIAETIGTNSTTVRKYLKANNIEFNSERTKRISNKELVLSDEQLEIIYGSLLGDATIGINWKNARLAFNHGGNQEEYFDYKCSFFKDILGKINKTPRYDKRTNKYYNRFAVRLLSHPKFTEIYNECYINGIKTVTKEWLNKITPRGLAFWFMDDGNNKGVLATNSFTYEEVCLIKEWFLEKYNIKVSIEIQNGQNPQYVIYILAESKPLFYKLVKPYVIESMKYKFQGWTL